MTQFTCKKCNVSFTQKSSYTRHLKSKKHLGKPPKVYRCEACNYETTNSGIWCKHLKTQRHKRGGAKKSVAGRRDCPVCEAVFKNPNTCRIHMYTHQDKVSAFKWAGKMSGKCNHARIVLAGERHKHRRLLESAPSRAQIKASKTALRKLEHEVENYYDKYRKAIEYYKACHMECSDNWNEKDTMEELEKKWDRVNTKIDNMDDYMELNGWEVDDLKPSQKVRYDRLEDLSLSLSQRMIALEKRNR